jgi:hypothetical protein
MLDKFLFGNKHIPEMYFGNIPVAKIYFGNKLIWQKESYVPYDDNCSIIITGDNTTQKFSVKVMKNGEDVTSSLDHFKGWAYIVNDVLPAYRMFLNNIPYETLIPNAKEFSITELINACKTAESITDSRYDDTKGEYHIDASEITSKAGGYFPSSKTKSCQNNIVVPYTLTEDYSTNDVWMVVRQNTDNKPVVIKTLQVATTFLNNGNTEIYVIHESGVLVYKKIIYSNTPSITTKTIGGVTYNYVTIDLSGLDTGTFSLKRNEKYFIKIKHANNNNNHYYYRNGGILGIVGYTTSNINVPNDTYNISSLTYDWTKSREPDMLSVNTLNHYAKYTGASNKFETNKIYKCKLSFNYGGEITENDYWMLNSVDGQVGYYSGPASELGITGAFVKSGAPIAVTPTDTPSTIYTENDSTKIFKFTGNTTADMFVKNRFYSCNTPTTVKAEITSAPDRYTVQVNDIYFATSAIHWDDHSSGWNGTGFYKVTNIDAGNDNYYTVVKQNQPVTDETDNMKAKLSSFNRYNYYDEMYGADLSNLTINTDHKHEILMGA